MLYLLYLPSDLRDVMFPILADYEVSHILYLSRKRRDIWIIIFFLPYREHYGSVIKPTE